MFRPDGHLLRSCFISKKPLSPDSHSGPCPWLSFDSRNQNRRCRRAPHNLQRPDELEGYLRNRDFYNEKRARHPPPTLLSPELLPTKGPRSVHGADERPGDWTQTPRPCLVHQLHRPLTQLSVPVAAQGEHLPGVRWSSRERGHPSRHRTPQVSRPGQEACASRLPSLWPWAGYFTFCGLCTAPPSAAVTTERVVAGSSPRAARAGRRCPGVCHR